MENLSQNAKELLALATIKELGCFEEAISLAKAEKLDPKGLPTASLEYLANRMRVALATFDEAES